MLRLAVESWIWYSVVLIVTISRYVSRALLFGSAKRLKTDDWIMLAAVLTYTTLVVCMNMVVDKNSNLLPPGFDISTLTPADIAERQLGSKLVLVVEEMQICTIWILKACLIIMYYRLTYVSIACMLPTTADTASQVCTSGESGRQDSCGLCGFKFRPHGDIIPGSLVPSIPLLLGCSHPKPYVSNSPAWQV